MPQEEKWVRLLQLLFLFFILYEAYSLISPYTTPPPPPPSPPKLRPILGNYEQDNATICSESIDGLMKLFRSIQYRNLKNRRTTGKFVVYQPPVLSGLGNRIPPLVSAAIYALLSDRGFLVNWPDEGYSQNTKLEDLAMIQFSDLFYTPFVIDIDYVPKLPRMLNKSNTLRIQLDDYQAEPLLCEDFITPFNDTKFLVFAGYRPFVDLLLLNENYKEKVAELGLTPAVVREFGRCLLNPSPPVWEIIDSIYKTSGILPEHKIVGVHIRTISDHGLDPQQEQNLWLCVWDYPPPRCPNTPLENLTYIYYLASDSNTTITRVPEDFRPFTRTLGGGDITRITRRGMYNALADIWMLGQSHALYGVRRTTYIDNVRILFDTKVKLMPFFKPLSPPPCTPAQELPCFINWDPQPNSLSCVDWTNQTLVNRLKCWYDEEKEEEEKVKVKEKEKEKEKEEKEEEKNPEES